MTNPAMSGDRALVFGPRKRSAPWIGWMIKALLFALLLHGLLSGGAVWAIERLVRILPAPAPGPARAQLRAQLLAEPLLPALTAGLDVLRERARALDPLGHRPLQGAFFHGAVRVGWSVRSGCFVHPPSERLFLDVCQLEQLLQTCAPHGKTAGWYAVGIAAAEWLQHHAQAPELRAPPEPEDAAERGDWVRQRLLQREQLAGYLIAPLVDTGAAQLAPGALEQLLLLIDAASAQRAARSAPNWIEPSRPPLPDPALRARWLARGFDPLARPPTDAIFRLANEDF